MDWYGWINVNVVVVVFVLNFRPVNLFCARFSFTHTYSCQHQCICIVLYCIELLLFVCGSKTIWIYIILYTYINISVSCYWRNRGNMFMSEVPTKFENNSEQMVSEGDFHQHGKIIVIIVIIWLEYYVLTISW